MIPPVDERTFSTQQWSTINLFLSSQVQARLRISLDSQYKHRSIEKEEWTRVLEDALDDLASSMSQGRWLTGIKKYKALKEKQSKKKRKLDKKVDLTANSTGPRKSTGADGIFDNGSKKSEIQISSSNSERLERLRQIVAEPDVPSRTPKSRHLLLCLAPLGSRVALPDEDSGFNLVPSTLGCSFRNSVFVLPEGGEEMDVILYGLHEWNTSVEEMSTRPVGGTFTLKGVPSLQQHRALSKALKLTVYVHLSLLLEQQLLIDSHAHLTFAQPRVRVQAGTLQPSALPSHNQNTPTNDAASSHKPRSLIPSGIFSFFSKRSPGRTSSPRDASSVRPSSDSVPFPSIEEVQPVRSSMDEMNSAARLRMFSFLSSSAPEAEPQKGPTSTPFSDTLARIEAQRNVLSSSTGVVFDPPMLLPTLMKPTFHVIDFVLRIFDDDDGEAV
ncbi:1-phosphatidylinositol-3-phosphate 5-kinase FAB1 [Lentinula edodes]|uniref:1-phosphatidylinositol-3-phosphate 5-kinase FAB1 n=1 Tax=Lentinula edodes TaxID=5353 RepID=A0A1Q3EBL0_LENED|nr:1-phosphatidylinositol-3-phosphate 5-kinase FAB1 [Lentinula edodes]